VHLLRNYAATQVRLSLPTDGLPAYYLQRVTDYIHDSLEQDIKLADLAAVLDMSQFHFGRCFKQALGLSPHQYIIQQRVERAKQLLRHKELSLSEIAFQCGFSSQSHLGEWFRKTVGITPKAYRKTL
jgi:AraC family transcriptional regulator